MNGLDKIVSDIKDEALGQVAGIRDKSQEEAQSIRTGLSEEAVEAASAIRSAAEKEAADMKARAESSADLKCRQALLSAKQDLIKEALDRAIKKAESLPDGPYFDLIIKMAAPDAHQGKGEIALGEKDLKRLPGDFEKKLSDALPAGAELSLSKDPAPIRSGFILRYEGIEENGSFSEVILDRKEELTDLVRKILFTD